MARMSWADIKSKRPILSTLSVNRVIADVIAGIFLLFRGPTDVATAVDSGQGLKQDYVDNGQYFAEDYVGSKFTFT